MQTTFWYVYKRGGGPPRYEHTSYNNAVDEAERLVETIGGEYEILEAKAVVKAAPRYVIESLVPAVQIMDEQDPDDGVPF
jgi:hypothetical protein